MLIKITDEKTGKEVKLEISKETYDKIFKPKLNSTVWEDENKASDAKINPSYFKEYNSYLAWNRYVSLILNIYRFRQKYQEKNYKKDKIKRNEKYKIKFKEDRQELFIVGVIDTTNSKFETITSDFEQLPLFDSVEEAEAVIEKFESDLVHYFKVFKKFYSI